MKDNLEAVLKEVAERLKDGRALSRTVDVAIPVRDLARQQANLERKFRHLVRNALDEEAADKVVALVRELENQPDLGALLRACSASART